ncbi:hypothetical protein AGMMS49928_16170 [Spirochaetia bacterium]|nr:hypothetical protein AGMMS49928_16170 [Spirochaetia bacterium]
MGIAACLFLFYRDLYQALSQGNEEPLGTVIIKKGSVTRRFEKRVLWDFLQRESPVYAGDFIRTSDVSLANVTLDEGSSMDLSENTVLQITGSGKLTRIGIEQGSISAVSGSAGLIIASGNSTVTLEKDGALSASSGGGDFSFQISGGSAVFSAGGETRTVEAGEAFTVSADSSVKPADFAVFSPPRTARYISSSPGNFSLDFSWIARSNTVRIIASADRAFVRITAQAEGSGGRTVLALPPGSWFWRAFDPSSPDTVAEGSADIIFAPPPRLSSPADGAQVRYTPEQDFRWLPGSGITGGGEAVYYLFEAADNPSMQNPLVKTQVSGLRSSAALDAGRWYWRVTPVYGPQFTGTPAPSEIASLQIEKTTPEAPALVAPMGGALVEILSDSRKTIFSWRRSAEFSAYIFAISKNANLSSPVLSRRVTENYFSYDPQTGLLDDGLYYWAVTGISESPAEEILSPVRSFTAGKSGEAAVVVVPPPPPAPPPPSPAPPLPRPAPPPLPPLTAPVLLNPVDAYVITAVELRANRNIVFSWNESPGASSYKFILYRLTAAGQETVFTQTIDGNDYTLTDLKILSRGRFAWTVQAARQIDGKEETSAIAESRFTIDLPELKRNELPEMGDLYGN